MNCDTREGGVELEASSLVSFSLEGVTDCLPLEPALLKGVEDLDLESRCPSCAWCLYMT
jgi:hypothetical protein